MATTVAEGRVAVSPSPDGWRVDSGRLLRLPVYERWLASWETALTALTTAERELVTNQLRLFGWMREGR